MKKIFVTLCIVILIISVEGRKTYRSRGTGSSRGSGSSRSSSRKTNPQPSPTSLSYPQASAPKPTLFGWQEKPSQHGSRQSKPSSGQSHSYPSSQTGLSGSPAKQPPPYQESVQRSNIPQQTAQHSGTQSQTNHQPSHSYPSSNGLSGSSGSAGYPQGSGLSGSGAAPSYNTGAGAGYPKTGAGAGTGVGIPQGTGISGAGAGYPHANGGSGYPQGSGMAGVPPPPYTGHRSGTYNGANHPPPPYNGNGYNHGVAHHPPPPYNGNGYNYGGHGGGYGGYNPNTVSSMPGYFGNNGNRFGGVSRSGSALTGIGIAGAGVGTILTGLALWNLARSTGHRHHTVIYDNRGQPVAVAPENGTDPAVDSILKDLVNCTLTISNDNSTEIIAIPCAIATSFTPEADVKEETLADGKIDNTKCTVTVVTKTGKEFLTTIPCSTLLNTAAENNVSEPPLNTDVPENMNTTIPEPYSDLVQPNPPSALKLTEDDKNDTQLHNLNCTSTYEDGNARDPINPCYSVSTNLTVLPLEPVSIPTDSGHLQ